MMLFIMLTLFTNVFCQGQTNLRGSGSMVSQFFNIEDDLFHRKEFSNFRERFNKRYSSKEELENRFSVFRNNLINILTHNADLSQNFTLGVNQFTDLSPEEFKEQYVGGLKTELGSYGCKTYSSTASSSPSSMDWRTKGAVTSVKDQGQCGSCWTFSATGAIEGAWAISKGQVLDLSEQELVDCAKGVGYFNLGCNGGQMESAFKFVIEHGQCSLSSYPYTAKDGTCKTCSAVAHISSCSDVRPNDQVSLKGAVAQQPVSVAISADSRIFQSYSGGVITSTSCYTTLNHGVLVVGYGTENGVDYWEVKNSWGPTWGLSGYVKILKSSSTNDPGICGISMQPSFPTV
jgi:C1A family cysteine protease